MFIALIATLIVTVPVTNATPDASDIFVVKTDDTPVRWGPSNTHYAFMNAKAGEPVKVGETVSGMARINTIGPLFDTATGVVRYPQSSNSPFNDRWETTMNNVAVYVVDPTRPDWDDTVGWVCTLPVGTRVDVVSSTTVDAMTTGSESFVVHTIQLPKMASGWIDTTMLEPANADQISGFDQGWVATPQWMQHVPTSPIANWNTWSMKRPEWIASRQIIEEPIEVAVVVDPDPALMETVAVADVVDVARVDTYSNTEWDALEATIAGTPLHKLNAAAVAKLRSGYENIVDTEAVNHPKIAEQATFRLRQLSIAATINATRTDIASAKAIIARSKQDLNSQLAVLNESPNYIMRGRLTVSPVFDGVHRPIMYRLQDPFSGRSLAYLSPDSGVDLRGMLGQRVGIVGRVNWDSQWQVKTIDPTRVDLVSVSPPE
jgi:hypothetical protein